MNNPNRSTTRLRGVIAVSLLAAAIQSALAQAPAPTPPAAPDKSVDATKREADAKREAGNLDAVMVVGSQIKGAATTDALPVFVVDRNQIDQSGALSGDELLREIPQMGDVLFDSSNNPQTSNAARGDVNSVNLRSLGVGNTLVLLNGRRLVQHPTSQGTSDTGTVPVQSFNSNSLPVSGLERLEILLDGAAAIYGADAVAGVVNTVLQSDVDGVEISSQYGVAEGTGMREYEANIFTGKSTDRGNISLFVNYTDRTALDADEQDFTRTDDLRPLFADDPDFAGVAALDGRSSNTPWARLSVGARPVIRTNGTAVTSTTGTFRVQPTSFGCTGGITYGNGLCLLSGNHNFNTTNREMRYDTRFETTVRPSVERINTYLTGHHAITDDVEVFGEVGFYRAESEAVQPPVVNLNAIWIPASNYWNPFGPVTFADGRANPNRLPGLTGVPTTGLPVQMTSYRYVDAGFQRVQVENWQSRFLGGLRGTWRGFDWESALVYSEAQALDRSPNVNRTLLQQQLALSTPEAYNPFSGGCVDTPTVSDCSPSSQSGIDNFVFMMERESRTTLTMADYRMNRADLFQNWAGDVGIAFGLEARRETQRDNRDINLDGTNRFTDIVTGVTEQSNVAAVSQNPDTVGSRNVRSAYVEFAVPLVAPEMGIPLMHSVNLQLAGRGEHYSDFGSVAKPKLAVAWDVAPGYRFRGSYSEGFRAPNLEQTNATQYARLASGVDYIRCEADRRRGTIASFAQCAQSTSSLSLLIAGNPLLEPEESKNLSFGFVFQPTFIPEEYGDFTFTIDRWRIEQEQIVGLLGAQTALTLDYLNRVDGGSNPLVTREAPTAEDIAFFAGTGIAPVGRATTVSDAFINLQPQNVEGVDLAAQWQLKRTRYGNFTVRLNVSKLTEFTRDPGDIVNSLFAARAAGTINALTPLPDSTQLIGQNGRPQWRASSNFIWSKQQWRAGVTALYMSSFEQGSLLGLSGEPYKVDHRLTVNLYGQYELPFGTEVRVGVRDVADKGPSLAEGGYRGSLHNPWGRYFYVGVNHNF